MRQRLCTIFLALCILQMIGTLCCNECGDQRYFSVIDLYVESSRIVSEQPFKASKLDLNEQIAVDQFCIVLTTGLEYAANYSYPIIAHLSFSTVLAACDTSDPLPTQQITQFRIVSNADLVLGNEVTVPAGQNLNDFLLVSFDGATKIPLSSFLNSNNSHPMEVPLFLFLEEEIAYNQFHRFTVKYVLNDGQSFEASTEKVIIAPN